MAAASFDSGIGRSIATALAGADDATARYQDLADEVAERSRIAAAA